MSNEELQKKKVVNHYGTNPFQLMLLNSATATSKQNQRCHCQLLSSIFNRSLEFLLSETRTMLRWKQVWAKYI